MMPCCRHGSHHHVVPSQSLALIIMQFHHRASLSSSCSSITEPHAHHHVAPSQCHSHHNCSERLLVLYHFSCLIYVPVQGLFNIPCPPPCWLSLLRLPRLIMPFISSSSTTLTGGVANIQASRHGAVLFHVLRTLLQGCDTSHPHICLVTVLIEVTSSIPISSVTTLCQETLLTPISQDQDQTLI